MWILCDCELFDAGLIDALCPCGERVPRCEYFVSEEPMEARIVCQPRGLSVRLGRRVNQGSSRKTDQLLLARAWVSSQGGLNTPYVFTQMAEARRPGNGIQPDSSLAVGMVPWMPQQRINRFRFLPLERRRRHFDRPPFRFACGWTGNFRIAKFAICGQRLATLVLGRESPDGGAYYSDGQRRMA